MKRFRVVVDGNAYEVEVEEIGEAAGNTSVVMTKPETKTETPMAEQSASAAVPAAKVPAKQAGAPSDGLPVKAPLSGTIMSVRVSVGDKVKRGGVLVTLEALKMENEIQAPQDGTVAFVGVTQGQAVETGAVLVVLK